MCWRSEYHKESPVYAPPATIPSSLKQGSSIYYIIIYSAAGVYSGPVGVLSEEDTALNVQWGTNYTRGNHYASERARATGPGTVMAQDLAICRSRLNRNDLGVFQIQ